MISQFVVPVRIAGTTLNTGGTASVNVTSADCLGFDFVTVIVSLGAIAAGGNLSVAKLQYSNDNTNWTDVTGGGQATLPGDTDDNKFLIWNRKNVSGAARYYRVVLTTSGAVNTAINEVYYLRSVGAAAPLGTTATVLSVNNT